MSRKKSKLNLCRPRRRVLRLQRKNAQLPKGINKQAAQTRSIQKVWSPSNVPRESLPDRTVHNQSKKKISAPRLIDRQKLRSPVTVPKRRLPYVYKYSPFRSPFRKRLRFTSPSPKKSVQHAVSRENTKVSKSLFQTKTLIESIEDDDLESLQPLDTLDEEQEHETITKIDTDVSKRLFPDFWFSIPEYSNERHQLEVKCVDSTHLFTRLRRHSCKGTLDGIDNAAWKRVAKDRKTFLSTVMIEDVIDPMSVSMARTHFSQTVENAMRENGDIKSAELYKPWILIKVSSKSVEKLGSHGHLKNSIWPTLSRHFEYLISFQIFSIVFKTITSSVFQNICSFIHKEDVLLKSNVNYPLVCLLLWLRIFN